MPINSNYLKTRLVRRVALTASIITALIASGFLVDLNKSEWAAWVQAVGAILAIFGSVWLASRATRSMERDRNIDTIKVNIDYTMAAIRLAMDAYACLDNTCGKMEKMGVRRKRPIGVERLQQLLQSLHIFAHRPIPPGVLSEVLVLQREIAYTLTAIGELGTRTASPVRIRNAEKRTQKCVRSKDRLENMRRELVSELNIASARRWP